MSVSIWRAVAVCAVVAALSGCGGGTTDSPTPPSQTASITLTSSMSSVSGAQGTQVSIPISIGRVGSFTGPVTLRAEQLPFGVTAEFSPSTLGVGVSTSNLTLSLGVTSPGTTTFNVRASGNGVADQVLSIALTVTPLVMPPFTVTPSTNTPSVFPGGSTTINLRLIYYRQGFSSPVSVNTSTLPQGITAEFSSNPISPPGGVLTIRASSSVAPQAVPITLTYTATGADPQSSLVVLTVRSAPSFLFLADSSVAVTAGQSATLRASVLRDSGFVSPVALSVSGLPSGIIASISPAALTDSTKVNEVAVLVTASGSVPPGRYSGTLTATPSIGTAQSLPFAVVVSGSGGSGGVAIALRFCAPEVRPLFVAYQDGRTGAWTAVSPDSSSVYRFSLTQTVGAVAFIRRFIDASGGSDAPVFFRSRRELELTGSNGCIGFEPGSKTVRATVLGLSGGDVANLQLGPSFAIASPALGLTDIAFTSVPIGPQVLLATRTASDQGHGGPSSGPNRLILRRGVDVPNGAQLAPVDFGSNEAIVPVRATVAVENGGADNISGGGTFLASANLLDRRAFGVGGTTVGAPAGSVFAFGIPSMSMSAGELHLITAFARSADGAQLRSASIVQRQLGDATLRLGPALSLPSVTTTGAPLAVRARIRGLVQPQYENGYFAEFFQEGVVWRVSESKAYRENPGSYDIQMPDLAGVPGYQSVWSLRSSRATQWQLVGQTVPADGGLTEGLRYWFASISGSLF